MMYYTIAKQPKKKTKGAAGPKGPIKGTVPGTSKMGSSVSNKSNTTKIESPSQSITFTSQQELDLASLNISVDPKPVVVDEPPKAHYTDQALVDMAKLELQRKNPGINLIVIGHVDAGKSTLMGRLLYELGKIDQRARTNTVRASDKAGKSSFSWAWELDTTAEERQRGITMDIASQNFSTVHRDITILDAPGHRDFIPNMISGASQADCALLVVDSAMGEFEAGFERGGQTKEHLLLVRSLGVTQVIVAVNKLDLVDWEISRYEKIVGDLRGFLSQAGFSPSKMNFVPVSAIDGVNLLGLPNPTVSLRKWYNGPTLVELLDRLEPPPRSLELPLRIPISNVFRGQAGLSSGLAVSGRICSGVVQVGERLKVFPGGETTIVRFIEQENSSVPWSAAGTNVNLFLSNIDQNHLNIGSVLCPLSSTVSLASKFTGQIIVFDITLPITPGTYVELFYHSRDVPATITKLIATLDRGTSAIIKNNPRVLPKHTSAKVEITIRNTSGGSELPIPVEPFKVNRELGRIVLRRGGETIAAGVILDLL